VLRPADTLDHPDYAPAFIRGRQEVILVILIRTKTAACCQHVEIFTHRALHRVAGNVRG
jgi:hypothetical protein